MASNEELDFASKLLDTQKAIAKKTNTSYMWNFGLTALIFGLLFGLVRMEKELSIESVNLITEPEVVMILLSIALLITQINGIALHFENSNLIIRIREIYKSINANSELLNDKDLNSIFYPDIIETVVNENLFFNNTFGKIYIILSSVIVGIGLRTVPIIAQVYVLSHLFKNFPYNGWLIALSAFYGFVQITVIVSIIKDLMGNSPNEGNQTEKESV